MRRNKRTVVTGMAVVLLSVLLIMLYGNIKSGYFFNQLDETGAVQKYKIAVITKSTTSAFWQSVKSGVNAASTAYNLDYIFEGPENEEDYETQNDMIRKAVEDGCQAIVFSAVDYQGNSEAIDEAAQAGVKIVGIDSDVDSDQVSCRIGTDNYKAGCMAGKAALDCKDKKLKIGIVNFDKNTQNGQEREQGFRDTVTEDDRCEIVNCINVLSTIEDAQNGTMDMLKRHPEINVLVTFNEWTSLGVGYAIQEMELGEKTHVVAFDSNIVSAGMLETGEVDALIVQNPYAMGYLGVETAHSLINGYKAENTKIDTTTMLLTRENMFEDEGQKALFAFENK